MAVEAHALGLIRHELQLTNRELKAVRKLLSELVVEVRRIADLQEPEDKP